MTTPPAFVAVSSGLVADASRACHSAHADNACFSLEACSTLQRNVGRRASLSRPFQSPASIPFGTRTSSLRFICGKKEWLPDVSQVFLSFSRCTRQAAQDCVVSADFNTISRTAESKNLSSEDVHLRGKKIEVMDTSLRDGEQTSGVSFYPEEKLHMARFLLEDLRVDRVELASARVSDQELEAVRAVTTWAQDAGYHDSIEILGFTDGNVSVDWIKAAGAKVMNLLAKGSRRHCELQLRKTPEEHMADIRRTVEYATANGLSVNIYLEDWSCGYLDSPDYVRFMVEEIRRMPVNRILLPDTLGIMCPEEVKAGIRDILDRWPDVRVDFHGHNDYGLATANALAALRAGASGVHVTVNGLGERTGNSPLETVVTAIHDKLGAVTAVNEKEIVQASRLMESFSGKRIEGNRPIVGADVYTHTAGIHADGDKKHNLYTNQITPERFARQRKFALGKLMGKASLALNLQKFGITLTAEQEKTLLERIKVLGSEKRRVPPEELPYLVYNMFGTGTDSLVTFTNVTVTSSLYGESVAKLELRYMDRSWAFEASGVGGYAAFMNALRSFLKCLLIELPSPVQYEPRVLHTLTDGVDATVEVAITWQSPRQQARFYSIGQDRDQLMAAVRATEKMVNQLILQGQNSDVSLDQVFESQEACLIGSSC